MLTIWKKKYQSFSEFDHYHHRETNIQSIGFMFFFNILEDHIFKGSFQANKWYLFCY